MNEICGNCQFFDATSERAVKKTSEVRLNTLIRVRTRILDFASDNTMGEGLADASTIILDGLAPRGVKHCRGQEGVVATLDESCTNTGQFKHN